MSLRLLCPERVSKFTVTQCLKWSARDGRLSCDGCSSDRIPRGDGLGMGYFLILPIKIVYFGVLFV